MAEPNDASNSTDAFFRPMLDFWESSAKTWAQAARDSASQTPPPVPREFLNAAGEAAEAYLRSPLFLQLLKQHIDTLIELKEWGSRVDKPPESPPPMDEVLARLAQMEQRLAAVEQQLSDQQLDEKPTSGQEGGP